MKSIDPPIEKQGDTDDDIEMEKGVWYGTNMEVPTEAALDRQKPRLILRQGGQANTRYQQNTNKTIEHQNTVINQPARTNLDLWLEIQACDEEIQGRQWAFGGR